MDAPLLFGRAGLIDLAAVSTIDYYCNIDCAPEMTLHILVEIRLCRTSPSVPATSR